MNKLITYGDAKKFLNTLHREFPLETNIIVKLTCCFEGLSRGEMQLNGTVVRSIKDNCANIYVDSSRSNLLVCQAIAHEYRHIMHWVNSDINWLDKYGNVEDDANLFGNVTTKKYFGFPV